MSLTKATYSMIDGAPLNVRDYGAVGDGTTDDSAALNAAATALQSGQSLYFPAGNYIVNTACVLIRGKSNIAIFGDGASTRLRPTGQGTVTAKTNFHTTFAIDQCSRVTVSNMVIESKGENWGNTDAYSGLAGGDPRTNAIINYGGSALLVARSNEVTLNNVSSRYCGSVGVVYLTSSQNVVVEECFANALSLGYAGFAVDNWADSSVQTQRTYKFFNCRVAKETATYSAKAGIAAEGDQISGRLINLDVVGCIFEDCAIGGDAPEFGSGVSAIDTRLTMSSTVTKSCYIGVTWQKRGGATDFSWCRVNGCSFIQNAVTGAYIAIGTATGDADVSITSTKIFSANTSVWAGVGAVTNEAVKVSSGIAVGGYLNGVIKVDGCQIYGGQAGIWAIDSSALTVTGSTISAVNSGITQYGGGILKATGNNISVEAALTTDIPIYMNTANFAASASYTSDIYVVGNYLSAGADTATNYAILLTGNSTLFNNTIVKNNVVLNGQINANSAVTYLDLDQPVLNTTQRVIAVGLAGANTYVDVKTPKEFMPVYGYAVGTDEVSRATLSVTPNQGGTRGLVRVVLSGDVRTHYAAASNVRVTMMI